MIARQLLWKVPRKINNVVNFKMLLLTRLGESLFRYRYLRGFEKFLHGAGNEVRRGMLNSIGDVSVKQFKLEQLGLVPEGKMEDIVKGAIGLATEGFFEGVADGTIHVHRDQTITRLLVQDGAPCVELADGTILPADIVLEAGLHAGRPVPRRGTCIHFVRRARQFHALPAHQAQPHRRALVQRLQLVVLQSVERGDGGGLDRSRCRRRLDLPEAGGRRAAVTEHLEFMDEASAGHHSRGTKIIPFSMHNVDEVLGDLHVNIPAPGARLALDQPDRAVRVQGHHPARAGGWRPGGAARPEEGPASRSRRPASSAVKSA